MKPYTPIEYEFLFGTQPRKKPPTPKPHSSLCARDILVGAKTIIQSTGWCQRQYAKIGGKPIYTHIRSPEYLHLAEQYSMDGALNRVAVVFWLAMEPYPNDVNSKQYWALVSIASKEITKIAKWEKHDKYDGTLAELNDLPIMTLDKVFNMLDATIEVQKLPAENLEVGWRKSVVEIMRR